MIVILANHSRRRQSNETITTQAQTAGAEFHQQIVTLSRTIREYKSRAPSLIQW